MSKPRIFMDWKIKLLSIVIVLAMLNAVYLSYSSRNAVTGNSIQEKNIRIALEYSSGKNYDPENDGIEKLNGVIDFTIANSKVAEGENACAKWTVDSRNKKESACYGNENCCKSIGLYSAREKWDEPLYLTYGMHGAEADNEVGAQLFYYDENKIYSSDYKGLPAKFSGEAEKTPLKEIESLENRNGITQVSFVDEKGNDIDEIKAGKANLRLDTNKKGSNEKISVFIKGFEAADARWENSNQVSISTENNEIKKSLEAKGIFTESLVSVKGINSLIDSYYGSVKLKANNFNKVLYCPDDTMESCTEVGICSGVFSGKECYSKTNNILEVFVPHFSTIIVGLENNDSIKANITSPDDSDVVQDAENVYLNFTANQTVKANYSIDGGSEMPLGTASSFSAKINGSLPFGVFANGNRIITLNLQDLSGNSGLNTYEFIIADISAPGAYANISNNSIFSGIYLMLNISSDEYANLSYRLNNNAAIKTDLGISKTKTVSLTPPSGQNNLTINISDMNGNYKEKFLSFNFSVQNEPSCYDAVQNSGETGIDCGGSCSSCISFSVAADEPAYNLTKSVYLTVIARANSTVNVTIKKGNDASYKRIFSPVFAGAPISETRVIDNTSNAGNYTIYAVMRYLNISEYKNTTFEMVAPFVSPISVTINANATAINENNPVYFTASISGTSGSVSYVWDFQNDGTIDSTSTTPTYVYGSNGTFTVNLTVRDSISNQTDTEIITSRKVYNVTVNVRENSTSGAIPNAIVDLGDEKINTSSDGKALFIAVKGRHELIVKKAGYSTFSNKTDVNGNSVFDVYLIEADIAAPALELTSPGNNERVSNDYAALKFKASDRNGINCRLYMSTDASFWSEINRSDVQSGAESYFRINNLQNGTYFWKISCVDRSGNANTSSTYSFVVDTSLAVEDLVSIEEQNTATLEFSEQVNAIIAGIDGMDEDGRQAAEAIQLKKTLEKSKTGIERANRDLESLKWRKLNETGLQLETKSILNRMQLIKDTTPRSISVLEKNEFIKYPNKNDIGLLAKKLANSTNYKFTKREIDALVDETYKLQSLMTVTTKVKHVEIEYMSGER